MPIKQTFAVIKVVLILIVHKDVIWILDVVWSELIVVVTGAVGGSSDGIL